MAARRGSKEPDVAVRSMLTIPLDAAEAALDERIRLGYEFVNARHERARRPEGYERDFEHRAQAWSEYNQTWLDEHLAGRVAEEYRPYSALYSYPLTEKDPRDAWRISYAISVRVEAEEGKLKSIRERLPLWERDSSQGQAQITSERGYDPPAVDAPVFIVHGSDTWRAESVARTVEQAAGCKTIILREMPNQGRTLIEKFEHNAGLASYAIVVLTADDEGGRTGKPERRLRGRQNVIFEMGYFFGRLGRERVSVLLDSGVEKPSDMDGIAYIPFDDAGAWKSELFREMHVAGFDIDVSGHR
jgi:predicted nucleotide-binding protein